MKCFREKSRKKEEKKGEQGDIDFNSLCGNPFQCNRWEKKLYECRRNAYKRNIRNCENRMGCGKKGIKIVHIIY